MDLVNYGGVSKKIKGYLDSNVTIERELSGEVKDREFTKINLIFKNSLDNSGVLVNLRKILVSDKIFYYYDIISCDKLKKTSYIAICEDDMPLLLISHCSNGNREVRYKEEKFLVYDKENKEIISSVKENLTLMGNIGILSTSLFDKNKNGDFIKDYKFYYENDNDTIIAYDIEADKFFPEFEFDQYGRRVRAADTRLEKTIENVEFVSKKVDDSLNEALSIDVDFVKIYEIKRK